MPRIAVVLFNLGGPDNLDAVKPFLRNLFSDPAIITAPAPVRWFLARLISARRAGHARAIYAKIGGSSPIRTQTEKQARALEVALADLGTVKAFPCMRYWHPFSDQVARAVLEFAPDEVVLLPLYPQFSTTTSGSSINDWRRAAKSTGLRAPERTICCYARDAGFVAAQVALLAPLLRAAMDKGPVRLLLSAHGLPKKIIARGDPYQWQVEQTCASIVAGLAESGFMDLDWRVCYQSRVGPLEWIGPATEDEITKAGGDGVAVVLAPVAFVSEHSETLVELDIDYRYLADTSGVSDYVRVPTVGIHAHFIEGLAAMTRKALTWPDPGARCGDENDGRCCPGSMTACGYGSSP
ncbi:MAG: ferrochelatase [Alphaproteobacteria bacterium]|nr:ferrochelatase [Alphaproteobacteria bacterium]MBL6951955.1 ferrochelatase [Alphaproteobacteria bacterium]